MDDREFPRRGAMAPLVGWLIHPVTIAGVVVLAVNDHLLKARYPGLLTGKLSDLAGLVVLPPLLALALVPVMRRRSSAAAARTALVLTVVCFIAVKATALGAQAASAAWSVVSGPSVVLADRTDLVALPAVAVAAWAWTRARRRPPSSARLRRIEVLVVLPAAGIAVAATSAPHYPDAVAVGTWRGMIVAGEGNAYHGDREPDEWRVSTDGRVWRSMTPTEASVFDEEGPRQNHRARQTCVPDDPIRCYRIVAGHLRVLESADGGGTWSASWEVPDGRRTYLARQHPALRPSEVDEYLSAQAIAVLPVTGNRYIVVVANGRDGFAVRDTSGQWERIGFGTDAGGMRFGRPLAGDGWVVAPEFVLSVVVGLLVLAIFGWRVAAAAGRSVTGWSSCLLAGILASLGGAAGWAAQSDIFLGLGVALAVLLGIPLTLIGVIGLIVPVAPAVAGIGRLLRVLMVASGTTVAIMGVFWAWADGLLVDYRFAAMIALVVMFVGMSVAASLAGPVAPGRPSSAPSTKWPPFIATPSPSVAAQAPEPAGTSPSAASPQPRLRPARPIHGNEGTGNPGGAVRGND